MRYGLRVGRNKRMRRYGARTNLYRHVPAGFGVVWLVAAACRNFAALRYGLRCLRPCECVTAVRIRYAPRTFHFFCVAAPSRFGD